MSAKQKEDLDQVQEFFKGKIEALKKLNLKPNYNLMETYLNFPDSPFKELEDKE